MPRLRSRRGPVALYDDHPGEYFISLCLNLLSNFVETQRGWRIRYCALSDVFTQCPEELSEFLKQRRRWTVSGKMKTKRIFQTEAVINSGPKLLRFLDFFIL